MSQLYIDGMLEKIHAWGHMRGLHDTDDLRPQLIKLTEELGELAAGVARDDKGRILDAAGDMLVVLVQFGAVYRNRFSFDDDFIACAMYTALRQIEKRRGQLKTGIFVKDEPKFMEGAGHD